MVLDVFKFCLENGGTDLRDFAAAETSFWRSKTSRISVATF
jgi:hypothetical protein